MSLIEMRYLSILTIIKFVYSLIFYYILPFTNSVCIFYYYFELLKFITTTFDI